MKKIINGKKYDTDTVEKLGERWNGESDLMYCMETLYRKKTGEYFIHGEGGPMTIYGKYLGNGSFGGGQEIKPLSEAEAREWALEYLSTGEYKEIFGPVAK